MASNQENGVAGLKILYYITSPQAEKEGISGFETAGDVQIVPVISENWNRDLSPWPAAKVFKGGEDFSGVAGGFLDFLIHEVIPEAESAGAADERYIAGYSLAGLFSVYAAMETGLFDGFASMSGSLWYDGFIGYLESRSVPARVARAYFSLGTEEKLTRNPRMCRVEECTLQAAAYMRKNGIRTVSEFSSGGHFDHVQARIAAGIRVLTGEL